MRLLLDTHATLWFYLDDPKLSAVARSVIAEPTNEKWVSPAVYWETAIKVSLGKYSLAQPFEDFWRDAIDANGIGVLSILPRHAAALAVLPYPRNGHRDPFDRLIVAQASVERMILCSADEKLDAYGIERLW